MSHTRGSFTPYFGVALASSGGALLFGICAIAWTVKGNWIGLVIMGLIALCHLASAQHYWRRYFTGKKRRDERKKQKQDSRLHGNDI
jgi:hypothetical protein